MNANEPSYNPPLALTFISAISIDVAGFVSLWIMLDIIQREGWRTMMRVMIPVYVLNALYLAPITLWTYLKHGRPAEVRTDYEQIDSVVEEPRYHDHDSQHEGYLPEQNEEYPDMSRPGPLEGNEGDHHTSRHSHMRHDAGGRPMFATITIAVCHCNAGCLLGDIVGEWFVYGTALEINGSEIWVEFVADGSILIYGTDYVLALFFWHLLPVLLHRSNDGPVRPENSVAVRKSRPSLLNVLRNRPFWLDGDFSSYNFRREVANGHGDILVDDADWNVLGALDGVSDQLVVGQDRGQGAMRVNSKGHHLNIDVRARSLEYEALISWT